jgi:hypothetical protein
MGSLFGGKKKSAPAPKPVVEEKPAAPAGATREEKLAASRRRAGGGRGDFRPLMSLDRMLSQGGGLGRSDTMTASAEQKTRLGVG